MDRRTKSRTKEKERKQNHDNGRKIIWDKKTKREMVCFRDKLTKMAQTYIQKRGAVVMITKRPRSG